MITRPNWAHIHKSPASTGAPMDVLLKGRPTFQIGGPFGAWEYSHERFLEWHCFGNSLIFFDFFPIASWFLESFRDFFSCNSSILDIYALARSTVWFQFLNSSLCYWNKAQLKPLFLFFFYCVKFLSTSHLLACLLVVGSSRGNWSLFSCIVKSERSTTIL